jgi:hypothetical protein
VNWIEIVQACIPWQAVFNAVVNLRILCKQRKLENIILLRRI